MKHMSPQSVDVQITHKSTLTNKQHHHHLIMFIYDSSKWRDQLNMGADHMMNLDEMLETDDTTGLEMELRDSMDIIGVVDIHQLLTDRNRYNKTKNSNKKKSIDLLRNTIDRLANKKTLSRSDVTDLGRHVENWKYSHG